MTGGEKSFDFAVDRLETYKGRADFYNLRKVSERGHDISRLPYSIKILLENAIRHSKTVEGSTDAANRLLEWPRSIGSEFPFVPYRVLLQDYTGVPLVVDLAAMRDAMSRRGKDPTRINSIAPLDLIIDHSVQVDGWGNAMALEYNIEKEYERNSERYALLKWAQDSFKNMRVFPPGKGICHQINLEYLSTVVAVGERDGRRFACPDTVVGTDSHTPMVNGLGVLGWGVGGMEAEAAMLGEPCHIPIPRVVGVKLKGELQEGATTTDLVLAVTELLRSKNVVDAFVEYFGEGYSRLSVPDRATLGNMSPEYGATVGFSPVDKATTRYLYDTGRDEALIKLVEEYCRLQGLFLVPESPEPRYSEVLEVDMAKIEPSVAGPRNPEERRALRDVPALARSLAADQARARTAATPQSPGRASAGSGAMQVEGQLLLQQEGAGQSAEGLADGSVIIAAITSCTNTSNPTVMIGAALLARNAVRRGLAPKAFVKCSLAPGSTVVKDYLEGSGLLTYLDQLGFYLVGYGCTTCISEGTPVLLSAGLSRRIEAMPKTGGAMVFAPTGDGRLGIARQSMLMDNGIRDCVELVLQDGRALVCTPDHKVLTATGEWIRADELAVGKDRVRVGLEGPLDSPDADEAGYVLRAGDLTFNMETTHARDRILAFARLLGHLLNDGSISALGQGRMNVGQAADREAVLNDIELLTGLRPAANRYDDRKWSIILPMALTRGILAIPGVEAGRRIHKPAALPKFVTEERCPLSVVREFLGGVFGADGHAPTLHRWGKGEKDYSLEPPAFSQSTIPEHFESTKEMMKQLILLLARCRVETRAARIYDYPTRRSDSSYEAAKDGLPRIEVRLELPDGLSFVENVGFRYCVDKAMRASAAAAYWRLVEGIRKQRLWMADHVRELHQAEPEISFPRARQLATMSLVGHEGEFSLPRVAFPHCALLKAHDRFSRLPGEGRRGFRPLHRENCGFPSPAALFEEIGVRGWFSPRGDSKTGGASRYAVEKEARLLPAFSLRIVDRRPAGRKRVYDLTVEDLHAFTAGTFAVHNCIGNSGPLSPVVERAIVDKDLYVVAALSGNRNFDGRINPLAKGAFLMSPMLVVAYALAGNIDFDYFKQPLGIGRDDGKPVYLKDLWPSLKEIKEVAEKSLSRDLYKRRYAGALVGDENWDLLLSKSSAIFPWDESSTYVRNPPWFMSKEGDPKKQAHEDINDARVLALLGDKITTDHISPAGAIPVDSAAAEYLLERGVEYVHFSTYGSRRGNHEVMVRGGFSNTRLKNLLADGKVGGYTKHFPSGEILTIYDAAVRYKEQGVPLVVIAGKQYGGGSSRDWAAKAPKLLGVRAVIAESFERIHRSNLVAMGVLPLEFAPGEGAKALGLKGDEVFSISGMKGLKPGATLEAAAMSKGREVKFKLKARIDNTSEMGYFESGGVLSHVLSRLAS